jgi:hypothetical protein
MVFKAMNYVRSLSHPCKYFSSKNASETRLTCVQNAKNERISGETIRASRRGLF